MLYMIYFTLMMLLVSILRQCYTTVALQGVLPLLFRRVSEACSTPIDSATIEC